MVQFKGNFYNVHMQGKTGFIFDKAFLFLSLHTVCLFQLLVMALERQTVPKGGKDEFQIFYQ